MENIARKGFFIFIFLPLTIFCQVPKNGNNWLFGYGAGLNFNFNPPIPILSQSTYFEESNSSYSDSMGNILLYCTFDSIFDKNYKLVPNGTGIKGYYSSAQANLILRHKENDSIYYLLSTVPCSTSLVQGLYLTKIKIKNNIYTVLEKNIRLSNSATERLHAVNHHNGIDIILMSHQCDNNVYEYRVLKKDGFISCVSYDTIGTTLSNFAVAGYSKFSASGRLLISNTFPIGKLNIAIFDNQKRNIVKNIILPSLNTFGSEFSSDEKYLYLFELPGKIIQLNLSNLDSATIINSRVVLFQNLKLGFKLNTFQLAPNKKIYFCLNDSLHLGVINSPDSSGIKCALNIMGPALGGRRSSFGLVNFNQSYFYTPSIDFSYKIDCISNSVKFWGSDTFSANTYTWKINRNKAIVASYTSKNIIHTFTDTGNYNVIYIADNGVRRDTISKSIAIYSKINKQFLGKDTAYAIGTLFTKKLSAPYGMDCQLWQDSSRFSSYLADTAGVYICKVTNKAFCEVSDTILIGECINNLTIPSIFRSRDTLYANQQLADSFVWIKNNVQYKITKEAFIKLTDTGTYRVEAAKKGHCNRSSINASVSKLSIHSINLQEAGIKLYPNPSNEKVFIQSDNDFTLLITDITGKVLINTRNVQEVNLPKGLYLFSFIVNQSNIIQKVIIW